LVTSHRFRISAFNQQFAPPSLLLVRESHADHATDRRILKVNIPPGLPVQE
jgi:hypothetical protein